MGDRDDDCGHNSAFHRAAAPLEATGEPRGFVGWVIETGKAPFYWTGSGFSALHTDAIRFARKLDAERVIATFAGEWFMSAISADLV